MRQQFCSGSGQQTAEWNNWEGGNELGSAKSSRAGSATNGSQHAAVPGLWSPARFHLLLSQVLKKVNSVM